MTFHMFQVLYPVKCENIEILMVPLVSLALLIHFGIFGILSFVVRCGWRKKYV